MLLRLIPARPFVVSGSLRHGSCTPAAWMALIGSRGGGWWVGGGSGWVGDVQSIWGLVADEVADYVVERRLYLVETEGFRLDQP